MTTQPTTATGRRQTTKLVSVACQDCKQPFERRVFNTSQVRCPSCQEAFRNGRNGRGANLTMNMPPQETTCIDCGQEFTRYRSIAWQKRCPECQHAHKLNADRERKAQLVEVPCQWPGCTEVRIVSRQNARKTRYCERHGREAMGRGKRMAYEREKARRVCSGYRIPATFAECVDGSRASARVVAGWRALDSRLRASEKIFPEEA